MSVIQHAKSILDAKGIQFDTLSSCAATNPHSEAVCGDYDGVRFNKDGYTVEIVVGSNRSWVGIKCEEEDNMSWEWADIEDYESVIDNPDDFF